MGRARRIVATVPTHLIDIIARLGDITRHPVPIERPEIDLAMLWHRRNDNAPRHRWLRDEIMACLGEDIATV